LFYKFSVQAKRALLKPAPEYPFFFFLDYGVRPTGDSMEKMNLFHVVAVGMLILIVRELWKLWRTGRENPAPNEEPGETTWQDYETRLADQ